MMNDEQVNRTKLVKKPFLSRFGALNSAEYDDNGHDSFGQLDAAKEDDAVDKPSVCNEMCCLQKERDTGSRLEQANRRSKKKQFKQKSGEKGLQRNRTSRNKN